MNSPSLLDPRHQFLLLLGRGEGGSLLDSALCHLTLALTRGLRLNYAIGSLAPVAHRQQIMGLFGLPNYVSQFQ